MSELRDIRRMLEAAKHAATAGDFASADELLRGAARIQEAELGPLHPDLANTLNNLAIVCEQTGRQRDAETLYRRAAAIASASLPADHPMVAESRQNLEDFCRARGVPLDAAAVMKPATPDTAPALDAFAPEAASSAAQTPTGVRATDARFGTQTTPPASARPLPVPRPPTPPASQPLSPTPRKASRSFEWVAIGMVVLVTGAILVRQPWSSPQTSTPGPTAAPTPPQVADLPPPAAIRAPIEQTEPSKIVTRGADRDVATDKPAASAPSSSAISLATAQLCQTFSTSGGLWQCDPATDSVARGPIVLYTRVRSLRDAAVVHRWYRGDVLRQSVKLMTRANATEGYRTYSRQTVDSGTDWRVEVRSADGDLLHEQRFAVR